MADERRYPAGVTCWIDTEQPDVEAARQFYGSLFGWSFHDAVPAEVPGTYLIASLDGADVAAIGPPQADGPVEWNTYIAVDDADATSAAVRATGGAVTLEPVDAGPGGRLAACADPRGARFRLWQPRRRLGAQLTNAPGSWNFSDLHTGDVEAASTFYGRAFGWLVSDLGYGTAIRVPGYGDHLESTIDPDIRRRQAFAPEGFEDVIGALVPLQPGQSPHWHVTFTVADRDGAAATAERLGGTVLEQHESEWTRRATIRDPQGAVFTASQFTPPTP
jgi:predicted enzyme related to lactoylglutathione lyase